jgi:hypothetical protein
MFRYSYFEGLFYVHSFIRLYEFVDENTYLFLGRGVEFELKFDYRLTYDVTWENKLVSCNLGRVCSLVSSC